MPQTSQTALVAGLPFFMVTFWGFLPSLFARHFTQYIAIVFTSLRLEQKVTVFKHGQRIQAKYITNSKPKMRLAKIRLFTISRLVELREPTLAVYSGISFLGLLTFDIFCSFSNCPLTAGSKLTFPDSWMIGVSNHLFALSFCFLVLLLAIY